MEGDRWIVRAGGYGEDPPADPAGFAAYLGTIAIPDLGELVRNAEPGAQGMTVAALEAIALRGLLTEGRRGLARRFFRRASRLIDMAWGTAVVSDLGLDVVSA